MGRVWLEVGEGVRGSEARKCSFARGGKLGGITNVTRMPSQVLAIVRIITPFACLLRVRARADRRVWCGGARPVL